MNHKNGKKISNHQKIYYYISCSIPLKKLRMLSYIPNVRNVENIFAKDEIWTRISFDSNVQVAALTTTTLKKLFGFPMGCWKHDF